jgi:hypothetical protein
MNASSTLLGSPRFDNIVFRTYSIRRSDERSETTKEKIYHLPFDQQYDKTIIIKNSGEFYAKDVKEAVSKGFRRAFRYMGQPTSI